MKKLLLLLTLPLVSLPLLASTAHADDDIDWMNMGALVAEYPTYEQASSDGTVMYSDVSTTEYAEDASDDALYFASIGPPSQPVGCKTAVWTTHYRNWAHLELYSVTINQHFCFGGGEVTDANGGWVVANISSLGGLLGIQWGGVAESSDFFWPWFGQYNGGHEMWRYVSLPTCVAKIGCYTNHNTEMEMNVYSNGTWDASAHTN